MWLKVPSWTLYPLISCFSFLILWQSDAVTTCETINYKKYAFFLRMFNIYKCCVESQFCTVGFLNVIESSFLHILRLFAIFINSMSREWRHHFVFCLLCYNVTIKTIALKN